MSMYVCTYMHACMCSFMCVHSFGCSSYWPDMEFVLLFHSLLILHVVHSKNCLPSLQGEPATVICKLTGHQLSQDNSDDD